MLDYYAGNTYDEEDGRGSAMTGNGSSSRGARSGEMQVCVCVFLWAKEGELRVLELPFSALCCDQIPLHQQLCELALSTSPTYLDCVLLCCAVCCRAACSLDPQPA